MKQILLCLLIVCTIFSSAFAAVCTKRPVCAKKPSVKQVLASDKYIGKTVELKGIFMGWGGKSGPPPVTRSDYIIEDKSGQIHVSGPLPKGVSMKNIGKTVTVKGTVRSTTTNYMGVKKKVIYLEVK